MSVTVEASRAETSGPEPAPAPFAATWRRWSWRRPFDYVVAATAVTIAAIVNLWLWEYIAPQVSPFFFAAVMFAAWIGGLGPGLFATALAAFACVYLFHLPGDPLIHLSDILRLQVFLVVAVFTSWLTHRREVAELAVREAHADLEKRVEARTGELSRLNQALEFEINIRRDAERELRDHQRQLGELASELALSEEQQRRKIATVLHDDVGPTLSLAQMRLDQAGQKLSAVDGAESNRGLHEVGKDLDGARQLLEQAISRARGLTVELSPPILYELGLEPAIEWLVEQTRSRWGITMSFRTDPEDKPLGEQRSIILFQAVRELLANCQKHSRASCVEVSMTRRGKDLCIMVEDDGVGFTESSEQSDSFGLFNIRERLRHEGASLHIDSAPGLGSRLEIVAPLEPEAAR